MRFDINQKKISIGDKYQIFIDGQQRYSGAKKLFRWLAEIELSDLMNQQVRLTIKKRLSLFRAKFRIIYPMGIEYQFETISYWKLHYRCVFNKDTYEIYGHRGRKYSVYKNGIQIAWWDKELVSWFNGDNYTIIADNDCNYELLIAFCLVIDEFRSDDNKSAVNIDVGHIGPLAMQFNPNWQPKN